MILSWALSLRFRVNQLRFRENLLYITVSEKIKTIDNTIEQYKAQYYLDKQQLRLALPSRNVGKYELWTDEDVLPDKPLPWKKNNHKQNIWIFTTE